jgi:ParB-like chromosome segregation protein Spo0J
MAESSSRRLSTTGPHEVGASPLNGPAINVPLDSLKNDLDVRANGVDLEHARNLAQVETALPPILVSSLSNQIIDGRHRVKAAELNGRETIDAVLFKGSYEEAFVLAVRMNVAHGLPLTLADRRAAAERIVCSSPELSDRSIAITAGLAAKTVRAIRRRVTAELPQSSCRVGRDGRMRPMTSADGRRVAVDLLAAKPQASLRAIAKEAGISVSTVRDVRERIRTGQDPIPANQLDRQELGGRNRVSLVGQPIDARSILKTLRLDPMLRYNDSGRQFLRWLGFRTLGPDEWRSGLNVMSPHSAALVSKLAHECAAEWAQLAKECEQKSKQSA